MFTRQFLAAVIFCIGLALAFSFQSNAQDQQASGEPTAAELYQQGISEFEQGDLEDARNLFRRVDPMQLPRQDRVKLYETLQEIDRRTAGSAPAAQPAAEAPEAVEAAVEETAAEAAPEAAEAQAMPEAAEEAVEQAADAAEEEMQPQAAEAVDAAESADAAEEVVVEEAPAVELAPTPEQLMAEANAVAGNDPSQAAALYQQIIASEDADASTKALASARLAQVRREIDSDLTQARLLIDTIAADLEADRVAEATAKLETVAQMNVNLGWFDQQRLSRQAALVQEKQAELAAAAKAEEEARQAAAEAAAREAEEAAAAAAEAQEQARMAAEAEAEEQARLAAEAEAAEAARMAAAAKAEEEARLAAEAQAKAEAEAQRAAEAEAAEAARQAAAAEAQAAQDDLLARYRLLRAQEQLVQARQAASEGQMDLAIRRYEQSLQLNPENDEARNELASLRARRTTEAAPQTVLEGTRERLELQQQAAEAAFSQQMNRARSLQEARNYPAALDAVKQAKLELDRSRDVFPAQTYRDLRSQAEALETQIDQTRLVEEARSKEDIAKRGAAEEKARREAARREQQREVQELLHRAMDLRTDMQYDEALVLVDRALFLDPTNIAAQAMKMGIEDSRVAVNAHKLYRQRGLAIAEQMNQNLEATIPYTEVIQYPLDWPELTQRRLASLDENNRESEANRRVRMRLREPVPIEFDANRLINVIDYLRSTTGVNFFVNWPVLEVAGIAQDTPISLQLSNVPAEQALRLVLQQASAGSEFDPINFAIIEGVVTISTERDLSKTTDTRVYDIRDLLVQVPNFTNAPSFSLSDVGGRGSGEGSSGGDSEGLFGDEDDDDEEDEGPTREELVEQITTLIQDTIGDQLEWAANGGTISSLRELNGNLIVKSTPENHNQIIGLLAQLRETRAVQISVEARFLLVDNNFLEDVGVDLDVSINDVGDNFAPIDIIQDTIGLAGNATTTLTPGRFLADGLNNRSMTFGVSYLDDLQVSLLVRATQASQRAISLTAPRVTFFNGQRAYVLVTREIAYISELEPIPDAVGFRQTIEVIQDGVVLDVEGTVSADRRYVTLTLQPSLATVDEIRQITQVATATVGEGEGQEVVTFEGILELPTITLTQVAATVSIPDQGTLLLGGQRIVAETEIEAGVPVLSKLPFVNRLFTNTSTAKDERTLLILVRPTIVIQSEEEEKLFPGLMENPDQYNIGRTF